jgi:hypothetical protein
MNDSEFYSAWLYCVRKLIVDPIIAMLRSGVKVVMALFHISFNIDKNVKEL